MFRFYFNHKLFAPICKIDIVRTLKFNYDNRGVSMRRVLIWTLKILIAIAIFLGSLSVYLISIGPDPIEKPLRQMSSVWDNYPFKSRYVEINGSQMHYIDEGNKEGPVFLFLHGNPTSSYLWRNVIPSVVKSGARVIAVDNIGFGASDRPDIEYSFINHATHIEKFIKTLDLKDITLVIHDWGSALGFDYAYRHQNNVVGIVFMESFLKVVSIKDMGETGSRIFTLLRTPVIGETLVLAMNAFIEQMLPGSVLRTLTSQELDAYREPFPSWGSRLPVLKWPREIPFDGSPEDVAARVNNYADWLPQSSIPKLHLYVEPGILISMEQAKEIEKEWKNVSSVFLGKGSHFLQEDYDQEIGESIVKWYNHTKTN